MTTIELKSEALFQLNVAQRSGIRKIIWDNDNENCFVIYNNGTVTTNNGASLSIQFELHGKVYQVELR